MYRYFLKRTIDFIFSLLALLLLSPFLIPVILLLFLTGEHYVFYSQNRIGYKKGVFKIWKFATMLKNSPNLEGGLHTLRNDPRVLPMGSFLRKTKINELPQIINILKGDMSIVGPRPLVDKTFAPYPDHIKENIYNVKPGLTGIGSIIFRDEERLLSDSLLPAHEFYTKHISPYKGELELWYQKNISLKTDCFLIFLTIWVIIFPKSDLVFKLFKGLPPRPAYLN